MSQTDVPEEKNSLAANFYGEVAKSTTKALLTFEQDYALTTDFAMDAEKTEVILGSKSDDIRDLIRIQDKMNQKGSFPELRGHNPEWMAGKIEEVKTKIDRISERNKASADHLASNTFVGNILDQYTNEDGTTDFAGAKRALNDKDLQKKSGMLDANGNLDMTRWEKARTALRAMEADYKADQKENSEKKYDEATKLILGKKLSQARELIATPGFPPEHREALSNWIKQTSKGEEPGNKESVGEYARLSDVIDSSDNPQDAVNQIVASKHLNISHAEKLIDRARAVYGAEVKDSLTRSDRLINEQLAPSETIAQQVEQLLTKDPEELNAHDKELIRQTTNKKAIAGEAKEALHDWIRDQTRLHASGKRKALTSQEIWDYASHLAALKAEPLDKQLEDIHRIQEAQKAARAGEKIIRFRASDGTTHAVRESDLEKAKKIDPKLKVVNE